MPPSQALADALADASAAIGNPALLAAVGELLAEVDQALAKLPGECNACGACCRFDSAGHRLYVTTAELAYLLAGDEPDPARPLLCGYQRDSRCVARARRPLGCRVYCCDGEDVGRLAVYEQFHERLGRLHAEHNVGYHYVELTTALADWQSLR